MRALCALTVLEPGDGQEALVACLDALFAAYWVRCEETTERGVLERVLGGVLGEERGRRGMFNPVLCCPVLDEVVCCWGWDSCIGRGAIDADGVDDGSS